MIGTIRSHRQDFPNAWRVLYHTVPIGLATVSERTLYVGPELELNYKAFIPFVNKLQVCSHVSINCL